MRAIFRSRFDALQKLAYASNRIRKLSCDQRRDLATDRTRRGDESEALEMLIQLIVCMSG